MLRAEVLNQAAEAVKVRSTAYGTPEDNFERIARLWNTHLANRVESNAPMTGGDVALMLCLVKIARLENDPAHLDSWIDICGYGACGGEIASRGADEGAAARQAKNEEAWRCQSFAGFVVGDRVLVRPNWLLANSLSNACGKVVSFKPADGVIGVEVDFEPDIYFIAPKWLEHVPAA